MKNFIFSLCILLSGYCLFGQCGDRYLDVQFEEVEVETVVYSDFTNFEMDIYTPIGDSHLSRPVVVFAFGGGFVIGNRKAKLMIDLCTDFARRGYVAASIDYTLADDVSVLSDSVAIFSIVAEAVADGKGAIRYFRKSHNEGNPYGIDPNQIWIGGNSAGAVLSLHLAFIDETDELPEFVEQVIADSGGFEGNRGNDGYSSTVRGVISLAGAISNLQWIDENEEEVLVLCHGDKDGIVDFNCDFPFSSADSIETSAVLCGSNQINERANEMGLSSYLKVFEGYDHVPWQIGSNRDSIYFETFQFAKNLLYEHLDCNVSKIIEFDDFQVSIFPNPTSQQIYVSTYESDLISNIKIFNLEGKLLKSIDAMSNMVTLDDLPSTSGLYLVKVQVGNNTHVQKLIIQ